MTYKRSCFIILAGWTIFAIGIITGSLGAQTGNKKEQNPYASQVYAEAFTFKSDSSGKGRLDVYIQVPYQNINFVKEGEQYVGRIEMSATAITQDKQEVWQISKTAELRLDDFTQATSPRFSSIKRFSTDLLPGKYELVIEVKDNESKKIAAINISVRIKDYSIDTLAVSDLMLVHRMDVYDTKKNIVPNLKGFLIKETDTFYFFFEIYNKPQIDSVQLLCTFINNKNEPVLKRMKREALTGDRTQIIWQIDMPSLAVDQYIFTIEAAGYSKTDPAAITYASSSRPCLVRMKDLPLTVTDIDKATDQLQYFAHGSEIGYIRDAATQEEKQKRFFEFWAKHDPDPKTPHNELMKEYYSRVAYANSNFSQYREGWRTDRGMIFIRFGPPQSIDRYPFSMNSKPYEIWYYYDHNRRFIFIDESGFGNYRLQYYGSSSWDRIN